MKKAKEAKKVNDVPLLEERVDKQREMLQIALKAAIEFGHAEIIEKYVIIWIYLSNNQSTPTNLAQPQKLGCA